MKLNYINRITFLVLLYFTSYSYSQAPTIQWQALIGAAFLDEASCIKQTSDGGYILAGWSNSNNGIVTGNHGSFDCWIVKLSSTGLLEWQKSYGGTSADKANSIIQTNDGGYILTGFANSNNGDVIGNHGSYDFWVIKLTSTGIIEWQKTLGGSSLDQAYSIIQTSDGGYVVAGTALSVDGDVTSNHGSHDYWIVKLSLNGIIEWQKSLGGTNSDNGISIIESSNGGYIVAGYSNSNDGNVTGNHGDFDCWVVKLTVSGIIEWQKSYGGTGNDRARCIYQTADNGYIFCGYTESNNGDVSGNHGSSDFWIIKITAIGNIEWQKTIGGTAVDNSYGIIQTSVGEYVVVGYSQSNNGDVLVNYGSSDALIVKISAIGEIMWQKTIGGTDIELLRSIIKTTGGEYVVAGYSYSNNGNITGNNGGSDYLVAKLNPELLSNNSFTENISLSIYPNPTKENITLQLNYFSPNQEITIKNILGKTIHNQKLEGLTTTINTSNLASGIYFLNLSEGSNKIVKKFIKE